MRADAVVFLVSEDWLASVHCREELEVAQQDGKRLLPVAWGIRPERMPDALSSLNGIVADPAEPVAAPAARVDSGARTDPSWLLIHRRLLQEAKDWERQQRSPRMLRRRAELQQLEQALRERPQPAPGLTLLQMEFMGASRQAAEARRRWTWSLGTGVVATLAIVAAVALLQWQQRQEQEAIASARRLLQAADQAFQPARSPNAALRLALAARATWPLPEVDDFLRRALAVTPEAARTLPGLPGTDDSGAWWMAAALAVAADGSRAFAAFEDGSQRIRLLEIPAAASQPVSELPATLPPGRIVAASTYGDLVAFRPEPPGIPPGDSGPGEVRVLELPALNLIGSFSLPGTGPTAVSLDEDGNHIALARDGRVEVWQLVPRRRVGTWQAPDDARGPSDIQLLRVHPSGRWVAAVPSDAPLGRAPLWLADVQRGSAVVLSNFADPARALAFDRSGRVLAAVDRLGSLRIFQLDRPSDRFEEVRRIALDSERVGTRTLALSPAGRYVAVQGRTVEVFDRHTGQRLALVDTGGPLAFSPDGLSLWAGDDGNALSIGRHGMLTRWNLAGASEFRRAQGAAPAHKGHFAGIDFLPGSHDLVTSGSDGLARRDAGTGRPLRHWPLDDAREVDGAVADPAAGVVRVLTPTGIWTLGKEDPRPRHQGLAGHLRQGRLAVASDGRHALRFSVHGEGGGAARSLALESLSLADGRVVGQALLEGHDMGLVAPALGGPWLVLSVRDPALAAPGCARVELRALDDPARVRASWPCPTGPGLNPTAAQLDPGGRRLVMASERQVTLLSLPEMQVVGGFERPLESYPQLAEVVSVSPDGAWIAVLDRSRRAIVTDLEGRVQARLAFARDAVSDRTQLRFSSDGTRLAAHVDSHQGQDSIWVWDWMPARLAPRACAQLAGTRPAIEIEPVLRSVATEICPAAP